MTEVDTEIKREAQRFSPGVENALVEGFRSPVFGLVEIEAAIKPLKYCSTPNKSQIDISRRYAAPVILRHCLTLERWVKSLFDGCHGSGSIQAYKTR